MNGRMYHPILGRFLSPDPYVQAPDFSQSFNRYSYCLNNPLIYTDPTGEFFGFGFLVGFWRGVFTWQNPFKTSWETGINSIKIWAGMFAGNPAQTLSRFTWELPQTVLGQGFGQISNLAGQVDKVEYYGGATVLSGNFWGQGDGAAVTLGSFITGGRDLSANPNNPLFQHEYGHYRQSQAMGWGYLFEVGIPSLKSAKNNTSAEHNKQWFEQDANKRAYKYFYKRIGDDLQWDGSNEIFDTNWLNMIHTK